MARKEFPVKVKKAAWLRCNGFCEGKDCGAKLQVGKFHYDHDIPDALGGEPTLENCRVLCMGCHGKKTTTVDVPQISKGKRQQFKLVAGIKSAGSGKIKSAGFAQAQGKWSAARGLWIDRETKEPLDPQPEPRR